MERSGRIVQNLSHYVHVRAITKRTTMQLAVRMSENPKRTEVGIPVRYGVYIYVCRYECKEGMYIMYL
jgi:hypothetical protein